MSVVESGIGLITVVEAGRTLALATGELRAKPSREHLEEFEQARWNLNRFAMGLSPRDVVISDCPVAWDDRYVRNFMKTDLGLFVPEVVSRAPEGLILQSKAYPLMFWQEQNVPALVRNSLNIFGWLKTERAINAPSIRTDEEKAREVIKTKHPERLPQTLNVYGEAGQVSKLLQGQYLDEISTLVRILGSNVGGRVVSAVFGSGGCCDVYWDLWPGRVSDNLGVRSVGV